MMTRLLALLLFFLVLLTAGVIGYWDMLTSEYSRFAEHQESNAGADDVRNLGAEGAVDIARQGAATVDAERGDEIRPTGRDYADQGSRPPGDPNSTAGGERERGRGEGEEGGIPSFDLLRAEPDGSFVVAGRAAPNTEVALMKGDQVVAEDTSGPSGDFVIASTQRLDPGEHELSLVTRGPSGIRRSRRTAVISVPARDRPEELLAMLVEPNEPTRIVALPRSEGEDELEGQSQDRAKGSLELPAAERSAAIGRSGPESLLSPHAEPAAGDPGQPSGTTLRVEAVEIEDDSLYIAGSVESGRRVRLYVDENFVGEVRGSTGDRFLLERTYPLPAGDHRVRADELKSDGTVVARSEVPFLRPEGNSFAAIADRDLSGGGGVLAENHSDALGSDDKDGPAQPAVSADGDARGSNLTTNAAVEAATGTGAATELPRTASTPAWQQDALRPVEGRVIIRRGDSLWAISKKTYGAGSRYTTIYLANGEQIRDPDLIYPGQVFRLPEPDEALGEGEAAAD